MTVSEARAALPRVLDRVAIGEEVTITRHGRPVAVLIRPDALRARRVDQEMVNAVRDVLDRGRKTRLRSAPMLSGERAQALEDEVRAGRSRR